jgi:hypothetical protein
MLGELERTVLHHLGIETAIGSIVDILEENTIHRGLDWGTKLLGVYLENMVVGSSG